MNILHAKNDRGDLLLGLDVTAAAWKAVNKKGWIQILRWPVVRWIADHAYLWFARNRYQVSWFLTGKSRCGSGNCYSGGCSVDDVVKKQGEVLLNSRYDDSKK